MEENGRNFSLKVRQLALNSQGFFLLGIIVAGGLISGLGLVLAEFSKQQQVVKVKAETAVELINLSQRISAELYNQETCKNTIGTGVVLTPLGGPWPYPIPSIKNSRNESIIDVGGKYGNGLLKIHSMKLKSPTVNANKVEAKFVVIFEKASKAIKGDNKAIREYPLSLEVDASDKLVACNADVDGDVASMKSKLCIELGGVWNEPLKSCKAPDDSSKKKEDMECPGNSLMAGFDSRGQLRCMSIRDCGIRSRCVFSYEALSTEPFCNQNEFLLRTKIVKNECTEQFRSDSCRALGAQETQKLIMGSRPTSSPPYREYSMQLDASRAYITWKGSNTWKGGTPCQKHEFLGVYSSTYIRTCCK